MENTHPYLKARIRVGSCKNPIQYKQSVQVFHHDDIPKWSRQRADEVREWASSKILKIEKNPRWNVQCKLDRPVMERKSMTNYAKDRSGAMQYNFRAEVNTYPKIVNPIDPPNKFHVSATLVKDAKTAIRTMRDDRIQRGYFCRTAEVPNNPKLDNAIPWNSSTLEDRSLRDKISRQRYAKALNNSKHANYELGFADTYHTPVLRSARITERVRKLKHEGKFSPYRSVERPQTEEIDRKGLKNRFALEPSRKYKVDSHTGVYEYNAIEKKFMWSDTGSYDFDSKGDREITINPDAMNFAGPTMAPVVGTTGKEKRINLIEKRAPTRYYPDGTPISEGNFSIQ